MTDAVFAIDCTDGRREVELGEYLDAAAAERATGDAIAWIKSLRDARVDGLAARLQPEIEIHRVIDRVTLRWIRG